MTLDPASPTPLSSPTGEGHLLGTLNPCLTPCLFLGRSPCHFSLGSASFCDWFLGLSWALSLPPCPRAIISPHRSLRNYLRMMFDDVSGLLEKTLP